MNLGEKFPVSPGKVDALKARMAALGIDARLIEESFVRGGGPGGQKINKTASCVQLRYPPLDLVVRCQRERQRSLNRFLALRELVDEIELRISPSTSRRLHDIERRRRAKSRAHRRSRQKHRPDSPLP